jgi:uncharacterized protein (DUF58 family)
VTSAMRMGTLVLGAAALLLAGWLTADATLWHAGWSLAGVALLAFLALGAPIRGMTVERRLPAQPCRAGDAAAVGLRLHLPRSWPFWYVAVTDDVPPALGGPLRHAAVPGRRRDLEWTTPLTAVPRGVHRWSRVTIEVGDPWGFIRRRRIVEAPAELEVWPRPQAAPWREPAGAGLERGGRPHRGLPTAEVSGVRRMQAGDAWTRVHWRTTARVGHPMIKQQEPAGRGPVTIVVEPPGRFRAAEYEEALSVAAGLVLRAARDGRAVRLRLLPGDTVRGRLGGVPRLMRALAAAPYNAAQRGAGPVVPGPEDMVVGRRDDPGGPVVMIRTSERPRPAAAP